MIPLWPTGCSVTLACPPPLRVVSRLRMEDAVALKSHTVIYNPNNLPLLPAPAEQTEAPTRTCLSISHVPKVFYAPSPHVCMSPSACQSSLSFGKITMNWFSCLTSSLYVKQQRLIKARKTRWWINMKPSSSSTHLHSFWFNIYSNTKPRATELNSWMEQQEIPHTDRNVLNHIWKIY